jgi:predicted pyridoxine 5'-phosphate oxidase superfamily flavin-nucleotide-binding protein
MNTNQLIDRLIIIKDRLANQSERDAINDAVALINAAQNVMRPLGYKLAGILDASLPLIDAEAKREAAREQGKAMRCITWKGRAAGAREAIAKAEAAFGYDMRPDAR